MCLMVTADHGPAVSGAHNTIVCARAGKDLVSCLASGLLTIVSYDCMSYRPIFYLLKWLLWVNNTYRYLYSDINWCLLSITKADSSDMIQYSLTYVRDETVLYIVKRSTTIKIQKNILEKHIHVISCDLLLLVLQIISICRVTDLVVH